MARSDTKKDEEAMCRRVAVFEIIPPMRTAFCEPVQFCAPAEDQSEIERDIASISGHLAREWV
jgi:hypothetical protein